jgi:hypothetical protein
VGNWYVLKRHLQTQVDAAALAGGPAFTGCFQNPTAARDAIAQQALRYAGDLNPSRDPSAHNPLMEENTADVHAVLNSNTFWTDGDPSDGSTLDWTAGLPCDTKFLDVKATDDGAPLLWKWIPFFPDLKTRARVEVTEIQSSDAMKPLGVPEIDPEEVLVLVVDEDGDPGLLGTIRGRSNLDPQSTPPTGLEDLSVWSRDFIAPVDLSGQTDFGVIIVANRSTTPIPPNATLSQICSPSSGQVECYGGGTPDSGISFIHAYTTTGSGNAGNPIVRGVTLGGGCAADLSSPYFNLAGGCSVTISATIDFGTGALDPTRTAALGGVCAEVSGPGGNLTWAGGVWTGSFTPAAASGGNQVDLSWSTDNQGACGGPNGTGGSGTLDEVAKPYVSDAASGPVQYLTVERAGVGGLANSIAQDPLASLKVTVGFIPPLREGQLTDPPIVLRGWNQPSQTQALDCDASGSGPNGWAGAMRDGCADPYQLYDDTKHTAKCVPAVVPKDCVTSQNGNFNENRVVNQLSPCAANPNRWDGTTIPPASDKRWMPLFILDQMAFEVSGKRTYPIRRFGMFYVTAVSGLNCPGDDPFPIANNKEEMWGHFMSFITPGFGHTIPSDMPCSFGTGTLCVSNLVE